MKKRHYKSQYAKRRKRYKRSTGKAGPVVKLLFTILGVLAGAAVLALAAMFVLEVFFRIDTPLRPDGVLGKFASYFNTNLVESPTPYLTPEPTPTPYPMNDFDPEDEEHELVFPPEFTYSYLADPYCSNGSVICSAGRLIDGSVKLFRLVEFDIVNGGARELSAEVKNDHIFHPVFNDNWLVYFDAHYNTGGGHIYAADLTSPNSKPFLIKEVYIGQPKIRLWDNYIAWTERTGSERDKLFVCDLRTQETAVVQIFDKSDYGTSMPYLYGGKLIWAVGEQDGDASLIRSIDLGSSVVHEFRPGVFVHDPEYNGRFYAWLDSHHAEGAKLWCSDGEGTPFVVAENVVEFDISEDFIAYGKDESVFIYIFESGLTFRISPERENAQFLGCSDGTVLWMDVTSREKDIIKYAVPRLF